jgi:hypothetical protein
MCAYLLKVIPVDQYLEWNAGVQRHVWHIMPPSRTDVVEQVPKCYTSLAGEYGLLPLLACGCLFLLISTSANKPPAKGSPLYGELNKTNLIMRHTRHVTTSYFSHPYQPS